jgi:hypothetical protein
MHKWLEYYAYHAKIACYVDIPESLCQAGIFAFLVHPVIRVEMSCRIGGFGHIHFAKEAGSASRKKWNSPEDRQIHPQNGTPVHYPPR